MTAALFLVCLITLLANLVIVYKLLNVERYINRIQDPSNAITDIVPIRKRNKFDNIVSTYKNRLR